MLLHRDVLLQAGPYLDYIVPETGPIAQSRLICPPLGYFQKTLVILQNNQDPAKITAFIQNNQDSKKVFLSTNMVCVHFTKTI